MKIMKKIDPRLGKLISILRKVANEEKTRAMQTVLSLWPQYTLEEIRDNPSIYKKSITAPPLMTSAEFINSLKSKNVPQEIIDNLALLDIEYRGFNSKIYHGQIIIHKDLKHSISKIFDRILLETDFPLTSVIPISMFDWNSSAKFNNSGAFDWRFVSNSDEVSEHAFGAAIDINPLINPWVREGSINPRYNINSRGTLHPNSDVVKIFKEEGWKWGGDWKNSKDWQHFYCPEIPYKYFGKEEAIE